MAEIHQVLWRLAVLAAVHHDASACMRLARVYQCVSVCRSRDKPRRPASSCNAFAVAHLF